VEERNPGNSGSRILNERRWNIEFMNMKLRFFELP